MRPFHSNLLSSKCVIVILQNTAMIQKPTDCELAKREVNQNAISTVEIICPLPRGLACKWKNTLFYQIRIILISGVTKEQRMKEQKNKEWKNKGTMTVEDFCGDPKRKEGVILNNCIDASSEIVFASSYQT